MNCIYHFSRTLFWLYVFHWGCSGDERLLRFRASRRRKLGEGTN